MGRHHPVVIFASVAILIVTFHGCNGDRTNLKIYERIQGSFPCFRRLNGTHQIGCASPLTGEVGVVHLVSDGPSLEWVTDTGPHSPYVVAMFPYNLTAQVMNRLKKSGRVSGILVLNVTTETRKLRQFSMDLTCPNRGLGLYMYPNTSHYCEKWNEPGEGILFENYDFPIFYVQNEVEALAILNCYNDFNVAVNGSERDWPLCAAQLKAHMFAAVDTPTCMRRSERFSLEKPQDRVCDPVGDLNVWGTIIPSNQSKPYQNPNGSVVVISARMDSASMFENLARGADSAGTGIATLLAVVKQLSQYKDNLQNSDIDNVYFILFHGESFGYIGSSRMVYDMKKGDFPLGININDTDVAAKLNITDIKYFIEIGQVGLTDTDLPAYYVHNSESSSFLNQTLIEEGLKGQFVLKAASTTLGLPTSSLQSFLKERPSLPGVVITNFDEGFRNRYYNSLFDDAMGLDYDYENKNSTPTKNIAALSAVIANTVLSLAGLKSSPVKPDLELAHELLHCYVETGRCKLFQKITGDDQMPDMPLDLYVGVNRHYVTSTQLTRVLLMYFQGEIVASISTEDDCKPPEPKRNLNYQWINGSCYESTVNISQAVSPAFVIDNYDWKSGKYSTWTESVWKEFSVRIFIKPSRTHDILTLVSGFLVFLLSFVIVGWFSSKSDIIFPTRPAGMAC